MFALLIPSDCSRLSLLGILNIDVKPSVHSASCRQSEALEVMEKEKLVKDDSTFCPHLFWDSHSQHKICDGLFPMTFAKWVHVYTFLVLRS